MRSVPEFYQAGSEVPKSWFVEDRTGKLFFGVNVCITTDTGVRSIYPHQEMNVKESLLIGRNPCDLWLDWKIPTLLYSTPNNQHLAIVRSQ